jgi:hypothetical protein
MLLRIKSSISLPHGTSYQANDVVLWDSVEEAERLVARGMADLVDDQAAARLQAAGERIYDRSRDRAREEERTAADEERQRLDEEQNRQKYPRPGEQP